MGRIPSMKPPWKDLRRYTGIPLDGVGSVFRAGGVSGICFVACDLCSESSCRSVVATHIIAHVMDLKSPPLFDRIRIKPRKAEEARDSMRWRAPTCEFPGCKEPGQYRAPKGRGAEGQYYRFCLQHVREIQCQV